MIVTEMDEVRVERYVAMAVNLSHRFVSVLEARHMLRALFMIVLWMHLACPLCADMYGAVSL
jgi:hypothetical protein